jgi:peptide/nickel transport system permease protein
MNDRTDLQDAFWEEEVVVSEVRWYETLLRSKGAVIGAGLVFFMVFVAVFAPWLSPHDPMYLDVMNRLQTPGHEHWFGTDEFGRDIFSRVVHGARISLFVGFIVMLVTSLLGILFGVLAAYYKSLDNVLMRIMDGLMALPGMLMAIALMAVLGPQVFNVIVSLSAIYMPRTARIVRSVVLVVRELTYVQAARALGVRDTGIMFKDVLPGCLPPVIVQGTFIFAYSILTEAALSFLGAGVPPHIPSWGTIISSGQLFMGDAPWISLFPGIAIVLACLGLNLLGDGLRDALDPQLREVL